METEIKIRLYGLLVDQLQKYNSILWQAPAAILATNLLAFDRLSSKPAILLAVALFNLAFIFALWRMVKVQRSLIKSIRGVEEELRDKLSVFIPTSVYIPTFPKRWLNRGAAELLLFTMLLLDVGLFCYAIYALTRPPRPPVQDFLI